MTEGTQANQRAGNMEKEEEGWAQFLTLISGGEAFSATFFFFPFGARDQTQCLLLARQTL